MSRILNFGHSYLFRISCLGFRIYKKLIKLIILKLQQVNSLNDLALRNGVSKAKGVSQVLVNPFFALKCNL